MLLLQLRLLYYSFYVYYYNHFCYYDCFYYCYYYSFYDYCYNYYCIYYNPYCIHYNHYCYSSRAPIKQPANKSSLYLSLKTTCGGGARRAGETVLFATESREKNVFTRGETGLLARGQCAGGGGLKRAPPSPG